MPLHMDFEALLRLCTVSRLGSRRIKKLIARFNTPEDVFRASVRELVQVDGIDKVLAAQIKTGGDAQFVHDQIRKARNYKADILTYWDETYPQLLKQVNDPPLLLYAQGKKELFVLQSIAIVGTRMPSTYGKLMADRFARELSARNIVVVSGLARGIDTIAHRAVVQSKGGTIAVLGSGVDQIYPEENKSLAKEICECGLVLSEFPMGAKPDAPHFPRRNRIISGLSAGVLVVEAGPKSGALITADFALEQNREVFALPGNINNAKSYGGNCLIQQGAKLVLTVDDILEELGHSSESSLKSVPSSPPLELSSREAKVYHILTNEPKHIDTIARETQLSISHVLGILLSLELKNIVQQLAGKNFVRCA
ncbi:DNA-protecting protein DprA [candidate division KSB1 bacterium]|nr:DNA-processing protein DprA [candidate division KSB1 bacterium]RQW00655.1 MAG: DNA-protecting protein DprA [candidate division KSB1 bacterium]